MVYIRWHVIMIWCLWMSMMMLMLMQCSWLSCKLTLGVLQSMIRVIHHDWWKHQGGRPRGEGRRPAPGPDRLLVRSRGFWSLLDDRKLRSMLISLCKPDMWAFFPYFLITPAEIDKQQNSWNSVRSNPNSRCCLYIGPFLYLFHS